MLSLAEKELLVARICSGSVRLRLERGVFLLRRLTADQLYMAQEVYHSSFQEALNQNVFTETDLLAYLYEFGLWDEERERLLQTVPKDIEQFKLRLFQALFRSQERQVVRKYLKAAKQKYQDLETTRHAHDYLSCAGVASMARTRYLIGCGLHTAAGKKVFCDETFWDDTSPLLDEAIKEYSHHRIGESTFRELARTEPWRSIWVCRKAEAAVFGIPITEYSEEQKVLVNFSGLYDSVYEHPDCPSDDVISDDDMLDGWLIDQRKQREQRQTQKAGEDTLTNEKIAGSQEVYMIAETMDDARRVLSLNDPHARAIQQQRMEYLKQKGQVNELDMPDTKRNLRMEVVKKLSQAVKG